MKFDINQGLMLDQGHNKKQKNDQKFINLALNLSRQNIGITAENPIVGCVITKEDNIVSTGITSPSGRPHAEIVAIEKIPNKEILAGATMYLTLEPCSHHGKTPPCVLEIIKHKISRVVICMIDPDPRVNGSAIEMLKKSGIEVEIGLFEQNAREINRHFIKSKTQKTPFVTIKIATSLDGKIATKTLESKWISSAQTRQFTNLLRSKNQAIFVGANTIRKDNPQLDCRIAGLANYSPIPVTISRNPTFSFEEKFFTNHHSLSRIIICPKSCENDKNLSRWRLEKSGNIALFCETSTDGKIKIRSAFEQLAKFGINSILVEGGKSLITQLLQENLVDEILWISSPIIIGNDGISAIDDLGFETLSEAISNFNLTDILRFDSDVVKIYQSI